jgi:N-acetyl-gamma-glutamyl-phosphate reductase
LKIGIINITGYAGAELARILSRHPEAQITTITGRSEAGKKLGQVFPHLSHLDMTIAPELGDSVDVVFSALPQVASAEAIVPLVRAGIPVVDISADFRLKSAEEYQQWYQTPHPAPDLLENSTYGLTELYRSNIKHSRLIANPGCYPTGAILALAPVIKEGLIEPDIVIDAKSGVSGAGRGLSLTTHFSEVNENVFAYAVEGHRHLPEITQELARLNVDFRPSPLFQPHLIPMTRGILTSCYATFVSGVFKDPKMAAKQVRDLYETFYNKERFVKVVSIPPQTKQTWGNNHCLIYPMVEPRTGRLVIISALDNLVKGAAGQAIQNMNLMLGLPDHLGLEGVAIYP